MLGRAATRTGSARGSPSLEPFFPPLMLFLTLFSVKEVGL